VSETQKKLDQLAARLRAHQPQPKTAASNGHSRSSLVGTGGVTDEVVIQKCRAAENAAKFADLFDHGDAHAHHGGDDSAADLALISMLAFYTQDEEQLERLFSSSALGRREKWLRRDDYRERTIRKALSNLGEVYDWPSEAYERRNGAHSRSRSLGNKVMSNDPKRSIRAVSFRGREKPGPREWIVEKAVCRGHAASWYGEGGILCLIAGLAILSNPLWSTTLASTWLIIIVGFLAMLQGAAGLIVALQGGSWGMGALSVLGILFGLFLVINPLIGVATLTFILAIFMLIGGVGAVVQAFRMRREAAVEQQPRRVR
jgi:uncharacterized membrane protein